MGARQRADRFSRAVEEGLKAAKEGKPLSACPYKDSEWGLGGAWKLGWMKHPVTPTEKTEWYVFMVTFNGNPVKLGGPYDTRGDASAVAQEINGNLAAPPFAYVLRSTESVKL